MPDRGFKHLLGETSLERKCRFIFGLGILVLVSFSFFWYGQKTESLVRKQTTQTARMLVRPTLLNMHFKALGNDDFESILDVLLDDLKPLDDLHNHDAWVLDPYNPKDRGKQPRDDFEKAMLDRFVRSAADRKNGHSPEKTHAFADGTPTWAERIAGDGAEYHYVQAVFFKPGCLLECHGKDDTLIDDHRSRPPRAGRQRIATRPGDLAGAVVVSLPAGGMIRAINHHRATEITFALTTAVFAMVSTYLAIRYVVIKPVERLRGMADAHEAPPDR